MNGQDLLRRTIARLNAWETDEGWRASGVLWALIEPVPTVTTVLLDTRPATHFYGNGDYDCPFCTNAILRTEGQSTCQNPFCDANCLWEPAKLQAARDKRAVEQREREDRHRTINYRIQQAEADRERHEEWRKFQVAEAKRRGACLNCLFQSGWERVKFIKHRNLCPKEQ